MCVIFVTWVAFFFIVVVLIPIDTELYTTTIKKQKQKRGKNYGGFITIFHNPYRFKGIKLITPNGGRHILYSIFPYVSLF